MLLFQLLYWIFKDIKKAIKEGKKVHLYGIYAIVGLYGGGKTMSLSNYLQKMRAKYGKEILIATNYFYCDQDFQITHWKDLLNEYDKPVIFAYDELQNEFNSREYKSFPVSLMTLLTQNRKGKGKQIVYTTQDYETVDKNFRRLTKEIWACKTRFGRLTSVKKYAREDFEHLTSTPVVDIKMRIKPIGRWKFVQTDDLRNTYDSYQMLESAKQKQYLDRDEIRVINS